MPLKHRSLLLKASMSFSFFSLALFLICLGQTKSTSTTYHIAATTDACGNTNGSCQTLSQFVAGSHSASNITVTLFDGNHSLSTNWNIFFRNNFTVQSSTTSVINCEGSPLIQISFIQNIHISNVSFIGCRMKVAYISGVVILSNSHFEGEGITGSALQLNNVERAEIESCIFISNRIGTAIGRWLPPYYGVRGRVGGAIFSTNSNINISQSRFENNSAGYGGAIFTQLQNTIIINSTFVNNSAQADNVNVYGSGSAVYNYRGTIDILISVFSLNTATGSKRSGGALYFYDSIAKIRNCNFNSNNATYGGVQRGLTSTIFYDNCTFTYNSAVSWGGVMDNQKGSNVTINSCHFEKNSVLVNQGGVVRTSHDVVTIINSRFYFNTAPESSGGALSGLDSNFTIASCQFIGNSASYRGGALYTIGSKTKLIIFDSETSVTEDQQEHNHGTVFINNYADHGGAVYSTARSLTINGSILISNNSAGDTYVFYIALTAGHISGNFTFSNNLGSVVLLSSYITLDATGQFTNNTNSGAISILQSTVYFNGSFYRLDNNQRENGGAIYTTQSKLYVSAPIRIENNRATDNGGGMYLYQSEISCGQNCHLIIQRNDATKRGGGIHAISSLIMLNAPRLSAQPRWIEFTGNKAEEGGGMLLESNAKLYIVQYHSNFNKDRISDYSIVFQSNSASYGGAVYIDDYTNSVGACNDTSNSPTSECFFQVLSRHLSYGTQLYTTHIGFFNNHALMSGPILHGGLLDRCTRSPFAEITHKYGVNTHISGIRYIEDASSITDRNLALISSGPVQVCPCVNGQQDCSHIPDIEVKKGQFFTISLTVINQIGHPVNATVTGYLRSTQSVLVEGQLNLITKSCERVSFRALSPHDSEELTLYASDGPCRDAPQSSTSVDIQFIPCNLCPIGFQPAEVSCDCYCHDDIKDYVNCNSTSELLVRESDIWIAYVNDTSVAGYLIYLHCPFGYCHESGVPVNLNQPDGADAQCRFNRTGILCGSCQSGLSLSLGSSRCLSCPNYWPAIFLLINLAALIAGIVLVVFLLALKLTVAVGTLNGLIFYANIVAVDKSILLSFTESNLITVIISWLNLELGIDTCYFPSMDTYIKAWLQLVFPTYVILLVVLVIIISNYSVRFSHMLGSSPVETLATLILFSYAKFIQTVITALSYGVLQYPDSSEEAVWLPDATINYFSSKHIFLFFAAIFILVVGLVYTLLLFTWQWFPSCSNWKISKVMNDPKFRTFMDMYTVCYISKHRYWTGLLLLVRIALYLVAAVNISGGPKVTLASVTITVGCIVILKSFIGSIYKKWEVDFLETTSYLNILLLTSFTWLALDTSINQRAVAYISVIGEFILLLVIVFYHLYVHTQLFSKFHNHKYCMIPNVLLRIKQRPKRSQTPELEDDDSRGVYALFESDNDSINITQSETGGSSVARELTVTVIEVPKPTSTEDNFMESDTFAEITTERSYKGKYEELKNLDRTANSSK